MAPRAVLLLAVILPSVGAYSITIDGSGGTASHISAQVYSQAMSMSIDFLASQNVAFLDVQGDHALVNRAAPAKVSKVVADVSKGKYGFYAHSFGQPVASIHQLRQVRKFYANAPVYVMSDGGWDFSGICAEIGNCEFQWRPNANDRWNPLPFFERFKEAARWLKTEYVVMLEPDVSIHDIITYSPTETAGGLRDSNPKLKKGLQAYMEKLGAQASGNSTWKLKWDHFGLAGGMYVKTAAALESFDADSVDWNLAKALDTHRVMSSDVAMPIVLAAHGYTYAPWEDTHQLRDDVYWGLPNKTHAFQHHGREENHKPFYDDKLSEEDAKLVKPPPRGIPALFCQGCVWVHDDVCMQMKNLTCPTSKPPSHPALSF